MGVRVRFVRYVGPKPKMFEGSGCLKFKRMKNGLWACEKTKPKTPPKKISFPTKRRS